MLVQFRFRQLSIFIKIYRLTPKQQNCLKRAGISKQLQECAIYDTDDTFKELNEELENPKERAQDHAPPQANTKTA